MSFRGQVRTPIPVPAVAGAPYEWERVRAESAKLLPNTTQTLCPFIEPRVTTGMAGKHPWNSFMWMLQASRNTQSFVLVKPPCLTTGTNLSLTFIAFDCYVRRRHGPTGAYWRRFGLVYQRSRLYPIVETPCGL
jgi:hypothetical protein